MVVLVLNLPMNNMKTFKEAPQTAVFTTKFVILNNSPILYVSHDKDGDWQFHGAEEATTEDAAIVRLDEMIAIDNSVLEVSDLPLGAYAVRKSANDPWEKALQ